MTRPRKNPGASGIRTRDLPLSRYDARQPHRRKGSTGLLLLFVSCFHFLRDHITNEKVKARSGNAIRPYEDLLTSVKRRKLKWYGHVTRSSGLAKTILQGTVQGERRRGRQRKRWEDNIKEWAGLEWTILLRKAENREEWRKLVVISTVVPQSTRAQSRATHRALITCNMCHVPLGTKGQLSY